jgi:hypothetical protein
METFEQWFERNSQSIKYGMDPMEIAFTENWCRAAWNAAMQPLDGQGDLGMALRALKEGKKVTRISWMEMGHMWLELTYENIGNPHHPVPSEKVPAIACIAYNGEGTHAWLPIDEELFATDYVVILEPGEAALAATKGVQ